MSNIHVNLDEANKHTPKGFDLVGNNTRPWKDEQGNSTYTKNNELPNAINFVDGTLAAPSNSDGDIFVLTGSGTLHADWGTAAAFQDWVRFTNTIATPITPLAGALCYDDTASSWMEFDGSVWAVFGGGGGGDTNLGTDNLTNTAVLRTYNINGNELKFNDGINSVLKIMPSGVGFGNVSTPTATAHIKGAGITSGTTALLVQNGGGIDLLEVKDDGTILGAFPVGQGIGANSFKTNGVGAIASASNCLAFGLNASASNINAISFGGSSTVGGNNGIAFGVSSNAGTASSIALGFTSNVTGNGGLAIGTSASATNIQTISIGANTLTHNQYSLAVGDSANCGGNSAIALGRLSSSQGASSIAIGYNMAATTTNAFMFGGSTAVKTNSTANSLEINFDEATSTIRLAKSADSWINTSANFGIGHAAPTAKLHIVGSTLLDGNLGVFGTTPIAQPTTGVAPSIVAPGVGTNVLQDDTFDGYTVAQVVKALRNLGILT